MPELKAIFAKWGDRLVMGGNLYSVVCIILVIVAALLRFYKLPEDYIWYDEAVRAHFSSGTFLEVISNRHDVRPILYPIVVYAVLKVESSPLSVRLVPAVAGVLTVAALLLLLPRVGVSRMVAFLSGLMAAVSPGAISEARGAQVYSVDAFVGVLLIIGLLSYLRDKKKGLLCTSLFIAPLLQYGLVLFCFAVLATAAVKRIGLLQEKGGLQTNYKELCKDLAWPGAFFLAACAISYVVTVRIHLDELDRIMGYLRHNYYRGSYRDVGAILEFACTRTWRFLTHFLPETVAIISLVAVGATFLRAVFKGFRFSAIPLLFAFSYAIAIFAAVSCIYPFGGGRHLTYLSPIIFVAFGHALHSIAINLPSLMRRTWLIAVIGIYTYTYIFTAGNVLYRKPTKIEPFLTAIKEQVQTDDILYIPNDSWPTITFYQKRENYYYGNWCGVWGNYEKCIEELHNLPSHADRIYLAFLGFSRHGGSLREELKKWKDQGLVESCFADSVFSLYRLTNTNPIVEDRMKLYEKKK